RIRDKQFKIDRLAYEKTEQARQDAENKAQRDARKAELRSELTKLSVYHENRSHLPSAHKRSRAPEIALRAGDETILAELNSELMAEVAGPVDPVIAQAEAEQACMARAKEAAKAFTDAEPQYYRCEANFKV